MLITFGGLPGTGKTTLAKQLSRQISATYLRIDTLEQGLRSIADFPEKYPALGYSLAYSLTRENLSLGQLVVTDSVNPIELTRKAWAKIALETGVQLIEIEIICSDSIEHRRRVETRTSDIPGLRLPRWEQVITREYDPWITPHLIIDTAIQAPDSCLLQIKRYLAPFSKHK